MYYVYVLHSASYGLYYKGFTQDVERRLSEHNRDKSRYTSGKGPWELLILEVFGCIAGIGFLYPEFQ
jgi:putative endonuclease